VLIACSCFHDLIAQKKFWCHVKNIALNIQTTTITSQSALRKHADGRNQTTHIILGIAVFAFIGMFGIYCGTYSGLDMDRAGGLVVILFLLLFVAWIAVVKVQKNRQPAPLKRMPPELRTLWLQTTRSSSSKLPLWASVLIGTGFVFAAANFASCMIMTGGWIVGEQNGQYVLYNERSKGHKTVKRVITRDEYRWYRAMDLREMSGIFLAFNLAAVTLLFVELQRCQREANEAE
jgi:hypothetical protein